LTTYDTLAPRPAWTAPPHARDSSDAAGAQPVLPADEPEEVARFTRWSSDDQGLRLGLSSFQLSGMHCAACAGLIERAVAAVDGVQEVHVSASAQRATVRWDPRHTRPSAMIQAVRNAGYDAAPDVALAARELRRQEHRQTLWRLFVAGFLAMQVMMMATPSYVAAPGELGQDLRQLLNWGSWILSVPVLWFAGMPFVHGAWQCLQARRIGMDVPVALGIAVTFLASTAATFNPAGPLGPEVYFDSMTMFLAFLWLGRYLEIRCRHQAAERLESTALSLPVTALRVLGDGSTQELSVHRLQPGDRVRVPAGAVVPADGPLLTEGADVSEALITGESSAVLRKAGQTLWAGSLNQGAPFEMEVQRLGSDTRQDAILALMREALSTRPASVRLADRWAGPFLWAVLALACLAGLIWWFIEPARSLWVAVAVLIVTCPCALWLATPATLVAAAGGLARRGVLLRRLDTLQAMASVRQVFLDKTGTLTEDRLVLRQVRILNPGLGLSAAQALQTAASLAGWSRHPASRALIQAQGDTQVGNRSRQPDAVWHGVTETAGAGLEGRDLAGRRWRLGAPDWASGTSVRAGLEPGAHGVELSCGGQGVAVFVLEEYIRPDALQALQRLVQDGLRLTLLSGDSAPRVRTLAHRLGLEEAHAGLSPQDKLGWLRQAQASGRPSAMVGDGLNDAPVLAAADVSVAMGHAALASRDGADAVIVSGRLQGLADLHRTALRCMGIVRQNLCWALMYNALCIPLALLGWLPPWAAGLGMAASSLLVMVNAQRAGA
jgi:Cu2+-exporting ATPase